MHEVKGDKGGGWLHQKGFERRASLEAGKGRETFLRFPCLRPPCEAPKGDCTSEGRAKGYHEN